MPLHPLFRGQVVGFDQIKSPEKKVAPEKMTDADACFVSSSLYTKFFFRLDQARVEGNRGLQNMFDLFPCLVTFRSAQTLRAYYILIYILDTSF